MALHQIELSKVHVMLSMNFGLVTSFVGISRTRSMLEYQRSLMLPSLFACTGLQPVHERFKQLSRWSKRSGQGYNLTR